MKKDREDYLRLIYEISRKKGYARVTDIAKRFGVSPSSVSEMLKKLALMKLIVYRRYEAVTLTEEGRRIGKALKERYDALVELLKTLLIPEAIALEDACKMEHNLHPITITQLKKFATFLKHCPKVVPNWIKHFKYYSETGEYPEECSERREEEN